MDIVEERGMEIDLHRLPELLGNIPGVPVSARKRTGLDVLLHAVEHHYEEQKTDSVVVYSPEIEEDVYKRQLYGLLIQPESQRLNKVKPGSCGYAGSPDISSICRNLRFK